MRVEQAVAILRHNTMLNSDVRLALREFDILMGERGRPLANRRELIVTLGGSRIAHVPKLSSSIEGVAVVWKNAPIAGLQKLIRCSAFAQEIIIHDNGEDQLTAFRRANPGVTLDAVDFTSSNIVALAWNYIIESEGVLDEGRSHGRVQRTIDLLLEPYRDVAASRASDKLRSAKKTTLSLSHDLHIYKAKFFPRMVRALLNIFGGSTGVVFDPFCGSGTALLEAALLGLNSVGLDVDPICQLISRTKIAPFLNSRSLLDDLTMFEAALKQAPSAQSGFEFPSELRDKIARRDRIDGTQHLSSVTNEAAILAGALSSVGRCATYNELLAVLASDAVTKKIRYRFIGVGNGKYTIEITKRPLLERLSEKIERCRQLAHVFPELQHVIGLRLGTIQVSSGDARDLSSWPVSGNVQTIVTSPPYLPASSGREHYASARALAFSVLGLDAGEGGLHEIRSQPEPALLELAAYPEAAKLLDYLLSDSSEDADPQRDAMRFKRKAVPTQQYLSDIALFFKNAAAVLDPEGVMLLIVAHQHTFYSHRRQQIEHVVSGPDLYGQLAQDGGLNSHEQMRMELLKSAASRARPRAKDDYFEAVLVLRPQTLGAKAPSLRAT